MNNRLNKIKTQLTFERTLVLVKPDGVQRGLIGNVISRFERKGLKLVALKMLSADDALLNTHYSQLVEKPFFASLAKYMKSSPLIAMVWEGVEVVEAVRILTGPTDSKKAPAGTIRGDYGMSISSTIVHSSDSVENAKEEVQRFFSDDELFDYDKTEFLHVYHGDID